MKIQLTLIEKKDKSVLANLLELYAHDFSELLDMDVKEDGRYGYRFLDLYWEEPSRFPFLIKVDEKIAGFVLVNTNDPLAKENNIHSIAEFFVMNKYRHKGVGQEIAKQVFDKFPGKWEIRQLAKNNIAQSFWKKVIEEYTKGNFEEELEEKGVVLKFIN